MYTVITKLKNTIKNASRRGQSILEILIATAVVSTLLIGLLQLGTYSNKTSKYSENLNKATEYSSQAIEWIKSQKNTLGWQVFVDKLSIGTTTTFCMNTIPSTIETFASNNTPCSTYALDNTFKREVTIEPVSHAGNLDEMIVTVSTYWEEGKYKAEMEAKVTKW